MKKNKKGFTLVELIATIAIISIVLLIGIRSLGSIRSKTLGKQYDVLVKNLYASGKKYYSKTGEPIVFIEDLVTDGFYAVDGDIKDPVNNNVMNTMFLNAAEDDGKIYYCNEFDCNNVYNHDIFCGDDVCIKDVYAYAASITIDIETTDGDLVTSATDMWTNKNVKLKSRGLDVEVKSGSKFMKNYDNFECTWYSKSNPNSSIGNSCDSIEIYVEDNKVFEETYILYVNARVKKEVESQYGDTVAFTAEEDVKIDKIPPTFDYKFKNEVNTSLNSLNKAVKINNLLDNESGVEGLYISETPDGSKSKIEETIVDYSAYEGKYLFAKDKAGNFSVGVKIFFSEVYCSYYRCANWETSSGITACNQSSYIEGNLVVSSDDEKDYNDARIIINDDYNDKVINEITSRGYTPASTPFDIKNQYYYYYDDDSDGVACRYDVIYKFNQKEYTIKYNFNNTFGCSNASSKTETVYSTTTDYEVKTPQYAFGNSNIPAKYKNIFNNCNKNADFVYWENKNNPSEIYYENDVIDFANSHPTMNGNTMELNAVWAKPSDICTLTFNTNGGGTINSVEGIDGKYFDLSQLSIPSKAGYVFDHWENKKGNTYSSTEDYKFYTSWNKWSCDDTLTAVYKKINYTVSYDLNGGSANGNSFASQAKITGAALNLYSYVPTKSGYDFDAWCTTKLCWSLFGAKKYSSGAQYTEDKDVTLYAQWNKKKTYKVKYECGGDGLLLKCNDISGMPSDQSFYSGDSVKISKKIPSRSGYIFTGWKSSDGLEYFGGEEYSNTKNLTLTAKWYKTTFSVTYVALTNAGSDEYNKGSCATIKNGDDSFTGKYKFLYWTDSSLNYYFGGEQYCSDTDLTLIAVYEKVKYTVIYIDYDIPACPLLFSCATMPENYNIGEGFTIKNKSNGIVSGYEFTGYYVDGLYRKDPGDYVNYTGKSDVIVFASYNGTKTIQTSDAINGTVENYDDSKTETIEQLEQKAKIIYMNEGSVYTTQYVASGSYTTAPKGPSKANNKFNVWNCNSQSVSAGSSFYVSGDMICYAQFVPDPCIYDKNHGDGTIGYSYALFEYNSSTGFGNSIPPNDAQCYSGNGATLSASYKAAYERKCNTSLCSTMGISGCTAVQINKDPNNLPSNASSDDKRCAKKCNYHQWWCIKS